MGLATLRKGVHDMATPISNLRMEKEGDWAKLDSLLKYMGTTSKSQGIKRDLAKAQRDFLTGLKRNLIRGLSSGGSAIGTRFQGHSQDYKAAGAGIGVKSGHYLAALFNARIRAKGYVVTLSLSKGDVSYKPNPAGITVGQYALIFEKGAPKRRNPQPARPLWQAAYKYTGGNKGVLNNMISGVGKRLGKMGIRMKQKGHKYIK